MIDHGLNTLTLQYCVNKLLLMTLHTANPNTHTHLNNYVTIS